ncbi:nucleotide-binding domain-containing protein, partial [Ascodesmis nigricans]
PSSILILGSGVFGLSTAYALSLSPHYTSTTITLLDRSRTLPAADSASCDNSRIIRSDYAERFYTAFASHAQTIWRGSGPASSPSHPFHGLGADGRYTQNGLLITTDRPDGEEVYIDKALKNLPAREREKDVRILGSREEVVELTRHAGGAATGCRGYVNYSAGWADAERAMGWVLGKVRETGRVRFETGEVSEVREREVELVDGRVMKADVVVVAVGSWVEGLMGRWVGGRVKRCPQPLGYVKLGDEEWEQVKHWPVHFNVTDGEWDNDWMDVVLMVIGTLMIAHPPTKSLKIAIHSLHGYSTVAEAAMALEKLAQTLLPNVAAERKAADEPLVTGVRLCCYADTRTGDFVVDWVPGLPGVMVAGGGSGHGFKFLPALGEQIVGILEGRESEFKEKWKWP